MEIQNDKVRVAVLRIRVPNNTDVESLKNEVARLRRENAELRELNALLTEAGQVWQKRYYDEARAEQRQNRWISVEEAVPEHCADCLVLGGFGGKERIYGFYRADIGRFCGRGGIAIDNVTHWMPVPESPKGGAE